MFCMQLQVFCMQLQVLATVLIIGWQCTARGRLLAGKGSSHTHAFPTWYLFMPSQAMGHCPVGHCPVHA